MPDLMRDQQRAVFAYEAVDEVRNDRDDYKITVHEFGASIQRSGLAVAMAVLERRRDKGGSLLLSHLAQAGIPGVTITNGNDLSDAIRKLEVDDYVLATREVRQVTLWLKRAVQAKFESVAGTGDATSETSETEKDAEG